MYEHTVCHVVVKMQNTMYQKWISSDKAVTDYTPLVKCCGSLIIRFLRVSENKLLKCLSCLVVVRQNLNRLQACFVFVIVRICTISYVRTYVSVHVCMFLCACVCVYVLVCFSLYRLFCIKKYLQTF